MNTPPRIDRALKMLRQEGLAENQWLQLYHAIGRVIFAADPYPSRKIGPLYTRLTQIMVEDAGCCEADWLDLLTAVRGELVEAGTLRPFRVGASCL
jgi:hypothetical protein